MPEAWDVAELRLRAAVETLTRVSDFDLREERDFVRGSAISLASWLADNFWRLRYESLPDGHAPSTNWRLRHEMTSAAGGSLWPPDEFWTRSDFGVISKAKTDRQKFQRAFAQNLLIPFTDLVNRIELANPTELQIEQAAVHYHVHPNAIRRLLILEGALSEETFEERLEAA